MLVLSRRPGESVRIGHDVRFTILRLEGGRARIGIVAPRGVTVVRDELTSHQVPNGLCFTNAAGVPADGSRPFESIGDRNDHSRA